MVFTPSAQQVEEVRVSGEREGGKEKLLVSGRACKNVNNNNNNKQPENVCLNLRPTIYDCRGRSLKFSSFRPTDPCLCF